MFRKSRSEELQCPCGLQEADFLNLLRSTFPLLGADRAFDPLVTDRSGRKLLPLNVESFTPEQVCRAAGPSALYLRLKVPQSPHRFRFPSHDGTTTEKQTFLSACSGAEHSAAAQ